MRPIRYCLIERRHERRLIHVECVKIANSGEDARHPRRDKRNPLEKCDLNHVRLKDQDNQDRHAAE